MARILAIEPDPERSVVLQRLVSENLGAEVVLTASTDDALVTLPDVAPDLILTSSLLSPFDDEQLANHLRAAPGLDHLPILTVPPLVEIKRAEKRESLWSRLLRLRRRRQQQTWPTYDFAAIAARIEEALEQSRIDAREAEAERPARLMLLDPRRPRLLEAGRPQEAYSEPTTLVRLEREISRQPDPMDWLPRAHRWSGHELPWLARVELTWGAKLRLLNISSTGLLVESDVRLTHGNRTDFQVVAFDEDELIVRARVVRTDLSAEGPSGAKYTVAAVFDQPFGPLGPERSLRSLLRLPQIA